MSGADKPKQILGSIRNPSCQQTRGPLIKSLTKCWLRIRDSGGITSRSER